MRSLHDLMGPDPWAGQGRDTATSLDTEVDDHGFPVKRSRCPNCFGRNSLGCATCGGTGVVCPVCRGGRVVRVPQYDTPVGGRDHVMACPGCCDPQTTVDGQVVLHGGLPGAVVNSDRLNRTMRDYATRWVRRQFANDHDEHP